MTASGPATILLTQGELAIAEAVTISGPGAELLTIDAQQQSRVFDITATSGDFTISGITLTRGVTNGASFDTTSEGGAIHSDSNGLLVLDHVVVSASVALVGEGAIYAAGDATLVDSQLIGNQVSPSPPGVVGAFWPNRSR